MRHEIKGDDLPEVLALLRRLIRTESTNPGAGEQSVAELAAEYIGDCGVQLAWQPVPEPDASGAEHRTRRNLILTLPADAPAAAASRDGGDAESALVLSAHMDTVVVGAGWSRDPFGAELDEKSGRIYGRGACDMKAGLACALVALRHAAERRNAGEATRRMLRVVLTVDEEGDMRGAEALVRGGFVGANDHVLDLEPTDGALQMAHKGRLWLAVTVEGITAHASRPELGADAVAAAAACITALKSFVKQQPTHEILGSTTITFGRIEGGYQPYVVPDLCRFWVDMRLAPPLAEREVLCAFEEIKKEIEADMPGIRLTARVTGSRPYIEENRTSPLREALLDAAEAVTGQRPAVEPFPGYTDTAVFAGLTGNRNCMSYGPGSLAQAHKPDEFVSAEDVLRCRRVLDALIDKLIF